MTSRTTGGTTATLSYDLLDHLTKWYVSSTNQEQYVYDSSGNRILRRSTTSSGTTMTVYAFGLEDHTYTGSGTNQGNTYYYSLAGRLIGSNDANGTVFYMTDTLGSILASFTNTAGGATLKGNQVFGPYGNARYSAGSINTAKGFTGQYNDALTGLDYYNARYYDPVAGVFLSADIKQGDMQGVNPYAYANGNPETHNDPTGHDPNPLQGYYDTQVEDWYVRIEQAYDSNVNIILPNREPWAIQNGAIPPLPTSKTVEQLVRWLRWLRNIVSSGEQRGVGRPDIVNQSLGLIYDVKTSATLSDLASQTTLFSGMGQVAFYAAQANRDPALNGTTWKVGNLKDDPALSAELTACGGVCHIFSADYTSMINIVYAGGGIITYTATPTPEAPVVAAKYAWWEKKVQSIVPVSSLPLVIAAVALALSSATGGGNTVDTSAGGFTSGGYGAMNSCSFAFSTSVWTPEGEKAIGQILAGDQILAYNTGTGQIELQPVLQVWIHTDSDLIDLTLMSYTKNHWVEEHIHTTSRHPFLTQEGGFVAAGHLLLGMRVISADGDVGVVTGIDAHGGMMTMYNLEVANDHTYLVGNGQWVVHNSCAKGFA